MARSNLAVSDDPTNVDASHTSSEADFLLSLAVDLEESPYEVVGMAGRGGMGRVVEVRHRALHTPFVVKVLVQEDRPDLEDRLRFEAQVLGRLSHRNLLKVIDFGRTPSGRPYLVSERLEGRTLAEALHQRGPFPVEEAIDHVCQALSGLRAAHAAGVVHRDIKLSNLFLCDETLTRPVTVKVIDFGVVKVWRGEESLDKRLGSVAPPIVPTATGMMVGTPHFMSPEQAKGERVDARSDLYGMGIVLYRLLTGRSPFIERDVIKLLLAQVNDRPEPASKHAPRPIPEALDAAILKALEKAPEDRFQSADEMETALRAILPQPPRASRRSLASTPVVKLAPAVVPSMPREPDTPTAAAPVSQLLLSLASPPSRSPVPIPRSEASAAAPATVRSPRSPTRPRSLSVGIERAAFFFLGVIFTLAALATWHGLGRQTDDGRTPAPLPASSLSAGDRTRD